MYIENKGEGVSGPARIGRVTYSKSGKSLYYRGRKFQSLSGSGFKANYFDTETRGHFWISGCKKRGGDRLYSGDIPIDDDVREEYWTEIRCLPNRKDQKLIRCVGKHRDCPGAAHAKTEIPLRPPRRASRRRPCAHYL